jgi:hypothetical protein
MPEKEEKQRGPVVPARTPQRENCHGNNVRPSLLSKSISWQILFCGRAKCQGCRDIPERERIREELRIEWSLAEFELRPTDWAQRGTENYL